MPLLGAMWPFGPVYECLSNGSTGEAKAHRDSHTWQGPVDFRTGPNTAGSMQPACYLLSHNIDDSLGTFSVILSIMHETEVIIPGNPILS